MKKLVLAAALTGAASTGFAGTIADPIVEPEVIVEEAASSSSAAGIWIPLLLLAVVAAVALSD